MPAGDNRGGIGSTSVSVGYLPNTKVWTGNSRNQAIDGTGGGGGGPVNDGDYGDITVTGTGTVWTIDPNVVTYPKMQQVTNASRVLGRGDSGAGTVQELTLGTGLSMSGTTLSAIASVPDGDKGDITVTGTGAVWTIDNGVVTYGKIQDASAASRLLGRGSAAGAGSYQEISLGTGLTMSGTSLSANAVVADGDKGDITVTSSGTVWTIDPNAVSYAKIQNTSAGNVLLGRSNTGSGNVQELTLGTNVSMSGTTVNVAITIIGAVEFVIDGNGSPITTGVKGDLEVPFTATITQATLLADQTGSIVVNVWKDTYLNFPPTVADKITASTPPTIAASNKSQDTTLSGWTTLISPGDILRFNVDSAATITRVTISLTYTRVV